MKFTQLANNILKSHIQENQGNIAEGEGYKKKVYGIIDELLGHMFQAVRLETNPEYKQLGEKAFKALEEYRNVVIKPPYGRKITTDDVTGGGKYSAD